MSKKQMIHPGHIRLIHDAVRYVVLKNPDGEGVIVKMLSLDLEVHNKNGMPFVWNNSINAQRDIKRHQVRAEFVDKSGE